MNGKKFIIFISVLDHITVGYNEPFFNEVVIEQVKKRASFLYKLRWS